MSKEYVKFDSSIKSAQIQAMFVWMGFLEKTKWTVGDTNLYGGMEGAAEHVTQATQQLRLAWRHFLKKNPQVDDPVEFNERVCQHFGGWVRENPFVTPERQYEVAYGLIGMRFTVTIDTTTPMLKRIARRAKKNKDAS